MRRVTGKSGAVYYVSPLLEAEGVRHAFSTRIGGVSEGSFASLNMGNPLGCKEPDTDAHMEENYRRLARAADLPAARFAVRQVHGRQVHRLSLGDPVPSPQVEADAIVSDDPTRCVSIRVADCAAVLITSKGGRIIAGVHAGWRGVVGGAVPQAIETLRQAGAEPVAAAVFPCISYDAFEVGPEVVEAFKAAFGAGAPAKMVGDGKGRVGVARGCELQLRAAGIDRVEVSDLCTYGRPDEFYSHRRATHETAGVSGRMALLAVPAGRNAA